jgi:hypothetical protein
MKTGFLFHQENDQYATLWLAAQIKMDQIRYSSSHKHLAR